MNWFRVKNLFVRYKCAGCGKRFPHYKVYPSNNGLLDYLYCVDCWPQHSWSVSPGKPWDSIIQDAITRYRAENPTDRRDDEGLKFSILNSLTFDNDLKNKEVIKTIRVVIQSQ